MQDPILQWVAQRFFDRTLQPRELLTVRKCVYIGLIVVLFTVSFLWRRYAVAAQADALALREQNRGDVELSGSLVRLTLTGSRGVATCVLWVQAIDKQKKNQWNELEFLVRSLTKLQPHFITPWLFQSWNLSYNVAVESDRVSDKYFYVTRGIQLLGEGEKQNRHNPQMRFSIGFYTQHKICQSDESNVMRSLFQLSCMPPSKRDPARFRKFVDGKEEFDWQEFEEFCRENPQLVRRLHDGTRRELVTSENAQLDQQKQVFICETADAVVKFLADNTRVPSFYEDTTLTPEGATWDKNKQDKPRKDAGDRFPVLPPGADRPTTAPQRRFEATPNFQELDAEKTLNDGTDAYDVARAWYGYSQEPLPDPDDFLPGESKEITNRVLQRQAKMMPILFRQYPALTQSQKAQRLQQEGWFDEEPWEITKWFEPRGNLFLKSEPARLTLDRTRTAQQAWDYAAQMWERHGQRNHLLFQSAADELNTRLDAAAYFRDDLKNGQVGDRPPEPRGGADSIRDEQQRRRYKAALFLSEYDRYRRESNFPHHYIRATVEKTKEATVARRLFFEAEGERLETHTAAALEKYRRPEALEVWRDILLSNPGFRNDPFIQEESFGVQLGYVRVLEGQYGKDGRRYLARLSIMLRSGAPVPGMANVQLLVVAGLTKYTDVVGDVELLNAEKQEVALFRGPFDVQLIEEGYGVRLPAHLVGVSNAPGTSDVWSALAALGTVPTTPLIPPGIASRVLEARGLMKPKQAAAKDPTPKDAGASN